MANSNSSNLFCINPFNMDSTDTIKPICKCATQHSFEGSSEVYVLDAGRTQWTLDTLLKHHGAK